MSQSQQKEKTDQSLQKQKKTEKPEIKPKKQSDGSLYFDLDDKKRVSIRKFKGKLYIDVREFYEKDGDMLPGKKGIALTLSNWEQLKGIINNIDDAIVELD
ncbi:RNA polymerase ii transcriptional coactivator, putative [Ichthyophthirius multifiliis]|uniref:RNA polymerase ii transcriptional coactivator, putative n=1 Tax=Ichthyophthirius multifiliis TaxID=5932 RepID=G0QWL5_ICHMU|nr:RNA polymerase ii transcriptional coactivator, putative [Ichthyophthirius multifiliis]EGR30390.1 RNA polymerase ii transcriptional coactivator, putative [Ichthyophthirius multifiliis]|eukprot:XP_004031977.1 RNA polymerase ii transcriptional coactivator, putative [Ichthyophthirius multifiliis]